MSAATEILQQWHNAQQADLTTLTRAQQVEYAIARRIMTHTEAMVEAKR